MQGELGLGLQGFAENGSEDLTIKVDAPLRKRRVADAFSCQQGHVLSQRANASQKVKDQARDQFPGRDNGWPTLCWAKESEDSADERTGN